MSTPNKKSKPAKPRMKANPAGLPAEKTWTVVRVGQEGEHTHILNPKTKAHYCRSGIKHGKVPTIYASDAKLVTCQRCMKLAHMGLDPSKGRVKS
jgi:hypothetical protein